MRAGRLHPAAGHLHHPHRVLGSHEAAAVLFGPPQAGQDERGAARDQMRAVELGRDVGGEPGPPQGRRGIFSVWRSGEEVSAQGEEYLGGACVQRVDRLHGVQAVLARGCNTGRPL